jgi:hypothetical protein
MDDSAGDAIGADPPIAGIGRISGKFWALLEVEDEGVESPAPAISMFSSAYLQPSPTSSGVDLLGGRKECRNASINGVLHWNWIHLRLR